MNNFVKSMAVVTSLVLSTPASASTLTDTFSSFWVLGDSLSDNGNLFASISQPPAPYFNGRFSNGPVWNESIIAEFRDAGQSPITIPAVGTFDGNFAYGGARTSGENETSPLIPGLDVQTGLLSTAKPAWGDRPLVSIWAGANNIFQELDEQTPEDIAEEAVNDIQATINALSFLGVKDFLVFNLPDVGETPRFRGTGMDQDLATRASTEFNRLIAGLNPAGANIIDIDVATVFADIVADPAAAGYANISDECINNLIFFATDTPCNPDTWAFWDDVHPTARVHGEINALVRERIAEEIAPVPLPASGLLLVFAIGGLAAARKRAA